ncbi:protein of unknown function [Brochothrix thermosphacta]|nr:protein of unknown function [Brochothrix thermosphacta]SPN76506.1 hypothetical protein BTEBP_70123 [Brochothrix thermosphacta]
MVPLFFVNKKTTAQNKVMTLFYTIALCAINYNRELGKNSLNIYCIGDTKLHL